MLIKDLTKELDSSAMAAIRGARNISPIARIMMLKALPALPPKLDPEPDGSIAFLLPPGAAD
jgi:hypothetical protein